jgi:hypothetical protein
MSCVESNLEMQVGRRNIAKYWIKDKCVIALKLTFQHNLLHAKMLWLLFSVTQPNSDRDCQCEGFMNHN